MSVINISHCYKNFKWDLELFSEIHTKSTHRANLWVLWNVDIIVLINISSAVVAIQSNIASLVFLGQLCIAYLYATKVARAILIAHHQFSYKKTPCKLQSVFVCTLLSSNELTFWEFLYWKLQILNTYKSLYINILENETSIKID